MRSISHNTQNSNMLLVETLCQQTAGVIYSIMEDITLKPLKEGSTFHWDFATRSRLTNTAENQASGEKVNEKSKEYRKNKRIQAQSQ